MTLQWEYYLHLLLYIWLNYNKFIINLLLIYIMLNVLKILSVIALLDYIIYMYYKKNYNLIISNDCYKYRIIICYIFWLVISYLIFYEIILITKYTYFIILLICLILYIFINIYNKYNYKNISLQFMCVDIVYGLFIINLLIIIIYHIR